ncbi:EamA-like transporter family protein [Kushneria sinocarnis]|uniref:EamA-like transporter family protein n=1 Tax=Kushneria sinocarnis TaxID=595502 RepID=A0A420WVI9_9GAMM|nr:EamA family transporter [Kushneria sinocarnis]RKR02555.1 EamA-like transporter family protein [Kushneria sinocarnis]
MTTSVFLAILAAAALHAGWNALVRVNLDRLLAITLIQIGSGGLALLGLAFVPVPVRAAWPWLALSAVMHIGYNVYLARAYRIGELGQVYPVARGAAPLLVTLVSVMWLGDPLAPAEVSGVLVLVGGIVTMAFVGGRRGAAPIDRRTIGCALMTACFIAAYTLSDGAGARINGHAPGYALWLFAVNGLVMGGMLWRLRGRRALAALSGYWRVGLGGGAMSLLAYGIVIWAMSRAPMALVAALRESSILFALLIATLWLKEPLGRGRVLAAGMMLAGMVVMRLS